jgi:hypothetical protein
MLMLDEYTYATCNHGCCGPGAAAGTAETIGCLYTNLAWQTAVVCAVYFYRCIPQGPRGVDTDRISFEGGHAIRICFKRQI